MSFLVYTQEGSIFDVMSRVPGLSVQRLFVFSIRELPPPQNAPLFFREFRFFIAFLFRAELSPPSFL